MSNQFNIVMDEAENNPITTQQQTASSSSPPTVPPLPLNQMPALLRPASMSRRNTGRTNLSMSILPLVNDDGNAESIADWIKSLNSDVSDDKIHELLVAIQEEDPVLLGNFTIAELFVVSKIISGLCFKKGDSVMVKGEPATFCAIILSGTFSVMVGQQKIIDMKRGAIIGESAVFEGGARSADVICQSDGIVGVITFDDLDKLIDFSPEVWGKWIFILAAASIRRLRRMTNTPMESYVSNKDQQDGFTVRRRQESLLGDRIRKQTEDHKKALEKEHRLRMKADRQRRNNSYAVENLSRKVKTYEDELTALKAENNRLQETVSTVTRMQHLHQELNTRMMEENDAVKKQLSETKAKYEQQSNEHANAVTRLKELQSEHQEILKDSDDSKLLLARRLHSTTVAHKDACKKLDEQLAIVECQQSELTELRANHIALEKQMANVTNDCNYQKFRFKEALAKSEELQKKVDSYKLQCDIMRRNMSQLSDDDLLESLQRTAKSSSDVEAILLQASLKMQGLIRERLQTRQYVNKLSHLCKWALLKRWVRDCKARKQLLSVLGSAQSLFDIISTIPHAAPNALKGVASINPELPINRTSKRERSPSLAFEDVAVDCVRVDIRDLIAQVDMKLQELNSSILHLRSRSVQQAAAIDSFFKQNVQLATRLLNFQKALDVAFNNYTFAKQFINFSQLKPAEHNEWRNRDSLLQYYRELAKHKPPAALPELGNTLLAPHFSRPRRASVLQGNMQSERPFSSDWSMRRRSIMSPPRERRRSVVDANSLPIDHFKADLQSLLSTTEPLSRNSYEQHRASSADENITIDLSSDYNTSSVIKSDSDFAISMSQQDATNVRIERFSHESSESTKACEQQELPSRDSWRSTAVDDCAEDTYTSKNAQQQSSMIGNESKIMENFRDTRTAEKYKLANDSLTSTKILPARNIITSCRVPAQKRPKTALISLRVKRSADRKQVQMISPSNGRYALIRNGRPMSASNAIVVSPWHRHAPVGSRCLCGLQEEHYHSTPFNAG